MNLANAYPNSAIPAWEMAIIAVVMLGGLAIWLVMVYLVDRPSGKQAAAAQTASSAEPVAQPLASAQDEHNEAGHAAVGGGHGVAA